MLVPTVAGARRDGYSHVRQAISELGERGAPGGAAVSHVGFAAIGSLTVAFAALAASALRRGRGAAPAAGGGLVTAPRRDQARPAGRGPRPYGGLAIAGVVGIVGVGLAYLVAAAARCDPGCPDRGSTTQAVHNAGGAVEYLSFAVALGTFGWGRAATPAWGGSPGRASC